MDLELIKFIVSTAFLALLLVKQMLDSRKFQDQHGDAVEVFRAMPKLTDTYCATLNELQREMRLMAAKMDLTRACLDHIADRLSVKNINERGGV